jgi:hypothetical protein
MRRSRRPAVAVRLVAAVATGCGDDDDTDAADAAYCDSLAEVRDTFETYAEIDVVEGGLDRIRE